MARSYARISASVWGDRAFTALSSGAQRTYFLAVSQSSIAMTGMVAYQPRRWATLASDTTPAKVRKAVAELAGARYVAVDEQFEELLVRSFIKHEKPLHSPKLGPALARQLDDILSSRLRCVVVDEIVRAIDNEPETPKGYAAFLATITRPFPQGYRVGYPMDYPENSERVSDISTRARTQEPEPEPQPDPETTSSPSIGASPKRGSGVDGW